MNRNGIIRPDAVNIETTYAAGPLANAVPIVIPSAGGMKVLALGGLTKVESMAAQVAEQLGRVGEDERANELQRIASDAVDLAEAIIAECERRAAKAKGAG